MKTIRALSVPLGCNCPGQPDPGLPLKQPVPMSLGAPASKLRAQPWLLAQSMSQVCLSPALQTYAAVCLQTCFLDGPWTHVAPSSLQPCLWPHLLLLMPGFPRWILEFIMMDHDSSSWLVWNCWWTPIMITWLCPDAENCVSILMFNLVTHWS